MSSSVPAWKAWKMERESAYQSGPARLETAPYARKDLTIETADGVQVPVFSKVLTEKTNYFDALMKGQFSDLKKSSDLDSTHTVVKIQQFSGHVINALTHYLEHGSFPKDKEYSEGDLLTLAELPDYFNFKNQEDVETFQKEITGQLKNHHMTHENALSWFVSPSSKELQAAALTKISKTVSGAEFLEMITEVRAHVDDDNYRLFMMNFVPRAVIDLADCKQVQIDQVFSILKNYGVENQRYALMKPLVGELKDKQMFSILEGKSGSVLKGFSHEDSKFYCTRLLVDRLEQWIKAVAHDADFTHATLTGQKTGLLTRKSLDKGAVSGLKNFAKIAHHLNGEASLVAFISDDRKLTPIQQFWLQSKVNRT